TCSLSSAASTGRPRTVSQACAVSSPAGNRGEVTSRTIRPVMGGGQLASAGASVCPGAGTTAGAAGLALGRVALSRWVVECVRRGWWWERCSRVSSTGPYLGLTETLAFLIVFRYMLRSPILARKVWSFWAPRLCRYAASLVPASTRPAALARWYRSA